MVLTWRVRRNGWADYGPQNSASTPDASTRAPLRRPLRTFAETRNCDAGRCRSILIGTDPADTPIQLQSPARLRRRGLLAAALRADACQVTNTRDVGGMDDRARNLTDAG